MGCGDGEWTLSGGGILRAMVGVGGRLSESLVVGWKEGRCG